MMKRFLPIVFFLCLASTAAAHGFGQRIDLPIPLSMYLIGGGATVAVSFILIAVMSKKFFPSNYSSYNLSQLRFFRFLTAKPVAFIIKAFFVFILFLTIAAGLYGSSTTSSNLAPLVIWIYFAIALAFFVAFIGNIWEFINPVKTLYEWFVSIYHRLSGRELKPLLSYPKKLHLWPAVVFYFVYRWIENNFEHASEPAGLASIVIAYTVFTFIAMVLFGKTTWLHHADPFGVLFRLLSSFSITETREQKLYLRPPALGLLKYKYPGFSVTVLILLMMASLTWDGIKETQFWRDNFLTFSADYGVNTFGIVFVLVTFLIIYLFFSYMIKKITATKYSTVQMSAHFILTLLPIAIAYEVAHFLVFLLTEGQRIIYLISDPFGTGWNLFGTANYVVNYNIINFHALWQFQVVIIVLAHVIAVYLAHATALRLFSEEKIAIKSQYPMIVLMVLYTMVSLWILAQPLVAS